MAAVTEVKDGETQLTVTYNAFRQVTDSSEKVVQLMGNIVAATQEQPHGIDQINRAVLEMNQITQENTACAEELASVMAVFKTEDGESGGAGSTNRRKMLSMHLESKFYSLLESHSCSCPTAPDNFR